MKVLFNNLNTKINEMLQDDTSLISQVKNKVNEQPIQLPISQEMIAHLLNKQEIEGISNIDVKMINGVMIISGSAKKMLMSINFSFELMPKSASNRKITFEILSMKPLNQEWIKKKVFNKSTVLSYENSCITIDLNEIDNIKRIPVGNIKGFCIKENKLLISLAV